MLAPSTTACSPASLISCLPRRARRAAWYCSPGIRSSPRARQRSWPVPSCPRHSPPPSACTATCQAHSHSKQEPAAALLIPAQLCRCRWFPPHFRWRNGPKLKHVGASAGAFRVGAGVHAGDRCRVASPHGLERRGPSCARRVRLVRWRAPVGLAHGREPRPAPPATWPASSSTTSGACRGGSAPRAPTRPDALARDQDPVKVEAFRGPSGRCDVDRASDGDVHASAVRAVAVAQKNSFDRRVVVSLDADPGLPALRQLAEGVRRQARRRLEPGPVSPGEHQREDDRRGDRGEERDGRTGQHFGNMLVDVSAPVGSCQPVPDVQ